MLSNSKLFSGQLEATIHRAFLRGANLRRWLCQQDCPQVVRDCKTLFEKIYHAKPDDDLHIAEIWHTQNEQVGPAVPTPDELRPLVSAKHVQLRARYRAHKVIYARRTAHHGNSLVLFYPGGQTKMQPAPGSIEHIYSDPVDGGVRFAVRRFLPIQVNGPDPYTQWDDFPAKLWSSDQSTELEAVEVDSVRAHFACYPLSEDQIVVLDLCKVSWISLWYILGFNMFMADMIFIYCQTLYHHQ